MNKFEFDTAPKIEIEMCHNTCDTVWEVLGKCEVCLQEEINLKNQQQLLLG